MKILHLISQHPEQTGSGFYVQNMIKHCLAHGHESHLVAGISGNKIPKLPSLGATECTFIPFEKEALNFTIPGMSDVMPYPSSKFSALTEEQLDNYCKVFAKNITEVVQRFSPDIIHSHHLWLATVAARRICPDLPMVTSCHSTDIRQYLQNTHLQNRVSGLEQIERILALSKTQRDQIKQVHGVAYEQIDVVGGGYDTDRFTLCEKQAEPPLQFIYAGKLSMAKGVPMLLQAIISLNDSRIHLHLVGSGTGEESEQCLKLAEQLGSRVTVHGAVSQKNLAKMMKKSHVFVLPSFFEGLPLVLLEALSSGCRVICSNLPGCRELLKHGDPDLVNFIELPTMIDVDKPAPHEIDAYIKRIAQSLKQMADRAMNQPTPSKESAKILTESYSWHSVFTKVEKAYKDVCKII